MFTDQELFDLFETLEPKKNEVASTKIHLRLTTF